MQFLAFVIAFFVILWLIDGMEKQYANSKRYQKLKNVFGIIFTFLVSIPFIGFIVAILITEKIGMKTGGFMQGVVVLVSGFGLPLAFLWIVNSPK